MSVARKVSRLIQSYPWEPGAPRRMFVESSVYDALVEEVEPEHVIRYGGLVSCQATFLDGHMNILFQGVAVCPLRKPRNPFNERFL